jgi:hypothetical protein
MRWHWYDFVQLLGAIASITGLPLLYLFGGIPPQARTLILVLTILGIFATVIASIIARAQPMTKVGRAAMVDTGKSIIRGLKAG